MKQKLLIILRTKIPFYLVCIFPFVIGVWGLLQLNEGSFIDCAYKMIQLYLMDYNIEAEHLNLAVQIARWTAPIVTAATIMTIVYSFFESIQIWWKIKRRDMIAIHGNSANIDIVLEKLGKRAIHTKNPRVYKAKNHILIFEEDYDMYRFLDENRSTILNDEHKKIYLCSENILKGSYENSQITVCNIAENCARDYWEKNPLLSKKEKVCIIGFENYGQRILTQAILKNVISTDSEIEYHIIGDYHAYLAKHYKMEKAIQVKIVAQDGSVSNYKPYESICTNHDVVYFYDMEWYDLLKRRQDFDRVIIAYDIDGKNLDILNELKTYYVLKLYHIKFSDDKIVKSLWNTKKESIVTFGVNEELFDPEVIMKEKLFLHAQMIHARYYKRYGCLVKCGENNCINCLNFQKDWNQLTTFVRYSNVAQADHISEKLRLLFGRNINLTEAGIGKKAVAIYQSLDEAKKYELWQIEHIRWTRYYFMNNWDYAQERDINTRHHNLLLPFEKLSVEEQRKDEEAYLSLEDLLN